MQPPETALNAVESTLTEGEYPMITGLPMRPSRRLERKSARLLCATLTQHVRTPCDSAMPRHGPLARPASDKTHSANAYSQVKPRRQDAWHASVEAISQYRKAQPLLNRHPSPPARTRWKATGWREAQRMTTLGLCVLLNGTDLDTDAGADKIAGNLCHEAGATR